MDFLKGIFEKSSEKWLNNTSLAIVKPTIQCNDVDDQSKLCLSFTQLLKMLVKFNYRQHMFLIQELVLHLKDKWVTATPIVNSY